MRTTEGVRRIAAERIRQIEDKGYTAEHDAHHSGDNLMEGALARAGAAYALQSYNSVSEPWTFWPFREGFRPAFTGPPDDLNDVACNEARIRDLERAGALIAAEIDRLIVRGDGNGHAAD